MERSLGAFPEMTLAPVDEFVEVIGEIFCVGRSQSEKLSLARNYSTKQDRYQELAEGQNSLFGAMVGSSIYQMEDNSAVENMLERHFGHMQQLVSWLRSNPVYQSNDSGGIYQELCYVIAAPQLAMLLLEIEPHLKAYSPLKHVASCLQVIKRCDSEPVQACRMVFRDLLSRSLQKEKAPDLSIRKNLNSLDLNTSKFTATQIAELKTLEEELSDILGASERRRLIDNLSGVYAVMMVLNRLKKIMSTWSPQAFPSFITALSDYISVYRHEDSAECSYEDSADAVAMLNDQLLMELYQAEQPQFSMSFTPETCSPYLEIISLISAFAPPDEIGNLDLLFKKGAHSSLDRQQLTELRASLQNFRNMPYFVGADSFISGVLAMHDGKRELSESRFHKCLLAASKWPLGILEHHAAKFCIGLAMSENPGLSATKINPLLSIYIRSMPQLYMIHPFSFPSDVVSFNLSKALIEYNNYCCAKLSKWQEFIFNPLVKVEGYLKKIFDWIESHELKPNDANIAEATRAVSTTRDIQRVRPYLADKTLIDWLSSDSVTHAFQYFPNPESLRVIPYVCRLLERGFQYPLIVAGELKKK